MGLMDSRWDPPHPTVTLVPSGQPQGTSCPPEPAAGVCLGGTEDRDAAGRLWPHLLFLCLCF